MPQKTSQAQSESPTQKTSLICGRISQAYTTPHSCVEPMRNHIIPYPLRNRTSEDDIHSRWLILWIAFTLDQPLGHRVAIFQVALSQVALSRYVPTLNESTNDRVSSSIGEPNSKDQPDRWENLSSLYHSTLLSRTDTESYHSIPLEKPDVHGQHSLWVAHTLNSIHSGPTFGAQGSPLPGSPLPSSPLPLRTNSQ